VGRLITSLLITSVLLNVFLTYQLYSSRTVALQSPTQNTSNEDKTKTDSERNSDASKSSTDKQIATSDTVNKSAEVKSNTKQSNNSNKTQTVDSNNENTSYGNVKGAITWQYNDFVGTKPDVGATVILIPKKVKRMLTVKEMNGLVFGHAPQDTGIFVATANGYGNFQINNVPSGDYTAIIISAKTRKFSSEPLPSALVTLLNTAMPFSNTKTLNTLNTQLEFYKSIWKEISVQGNTDTDLSYDFGFTDI
jgi:hypothetical protein